MIITQEGDPTAQFDILQKIGEGSYGNVFKALHKASGIICAIKIVYIEDDLSDLEKEIQVMQESTNENIVKVFGSFCVQESKELWVNLKFIFTDYNGILWRWITSGHHEDL